VKKPRTHADDDAQKNCFCSGRAEPVLIDKLALGIVAMVTTAAAVRLASRSLHGMMAGAVILRHGSGALCAAGRPIEACAAGRMRAQVCRHWAIDGVGAASCAANCGPFLTALASPPVARVGNNGTRQDQCQSDAGAGISVRLGSLWRHRATWVAHADWRY